MANRPVIVNARYELTAASCDLAPVFGSFEPEGERVRYGLTTNIETFNPVRIAFHEYATLGRELRAARSWRVRWNLLLRGPG